MVREQLTRDPPPSTAALYGRAAHMNGDIYDLSLRQFHALYPLRVKRERARADGGASSDGSPPREAADRTGTDPDGADADGAVSETPAPTGTMGPEARRRIRRVLWGFAREVAGAHTVPALAEVVDRLPARVDRIAGILSGASASGVPSPVPDRTPPPGKG